MTFQDNGQIFMKKYNDGVGRLRRPEQKAEIKKPPLLSGGVMNIKETNIHFPFFIIKQGSFFQRCHFEKTTKFKI